jgi:hypothetical protein
MFFITVYVSVKNVLTIRVFKAIYAFMGVCVMVGFVKFISEVLRMLVRIRDLICGILVSVS